MGVGQCTPEQKIAGYGAVWQYCDPITDVFITFAGTKDVAMPTLSREALDTTSGDGPSWATFIPDPVKMVEEVDVEADFVLDQWDRMRHLFEDDTITRWRLVITQIASEPALEFCAFILSLGAEFPLRDLATHTITLKPSGKPERKDLA